MISLIIHTNPIRQIGENSAFDAAQPRHQTTVTTGPLLSAIDGENDNVDVSFKASNDLQTALVSANDKRIQMFENGVLEFDGTINSVVFDEFVQLTGAA